MPYYYVRKPEPGESVDDSITGFIVEHVPVPLDTPVSIEGTGCTTKRLVPLSDAEWEELNQEGYASIKEELE